MSTSKQPLWWPDHLLDEVMPEGKIDPIEWITKAEDGSWRLGATHEGFYFMPGGKVVTDGQILSFTKSTHLGDEDVIIYPDGTFHPQDAEPAGYNQVWVRGDIDTMAANLSDFIKMYGHTAEPDGSVFELTFCRWDGATFVLHIKDRTAILAPFEREAQA